MAHGITTAMIPGRAFHLPALLARIVCAQMAKPTWPEVSREKDTDRVKGIHFVRVIRYLQTSEPSRRADGTRPDIHITEVEVCISVKPIGAISLPFSCSVRAHSWRIFFPLRHSYIRNVVAYMLNCSRHAQQPIYTARETRRRGLDQTTASDLTCDPACSQISPTQKDHSSALAILVNRLAMESIFIAPCRVVLSSATQLNAMVRSYFGFQAVLHFESKHI